MSRQKRKRQKKKKKKVWIKKNNYYICFSFSEIHSHWLWISLSFNMVGFFFKKKFGSLKSMCMFAVGMTRQSKIKNSTMNFLKEVSISSRVGSFFPRVNFVNVDTFFIYV